MDNIWSFGPPSDIAHAAFNAVWVLIILASFGAAICWRWRALWIAPLFALSAALLAPIVSQIAMYQPTFLGGPGHSASVYLDSVLYAAIAFLPTSMAAAFCGFVCRILAIAFRP